MRVDQIYVNLPVKDIQQTRTFWTKLGFAINEQFSDDKAICVVLNDTNIFAMFLQEEYFKTFTNRPLATGSTTQVLLAIGVSTKEEVENMVNTALENGGSQYSDPQDHGWMYQSSFADLNGHQWEVMFADISKFPQ